jgi:hypothetical protein
MYDVINARSPRVFSPSWRTCLLVILCLFAAPLFSANALAHAVAAGDKGYIQEISGANILAFIVLNIW